MGLDICNNSCTSDLQRGVVVSCALYLQEVRQGLHLEHALNHNTALPQRKPMTAGLHTMRTWQQRNGLRVHKALCHHSL